MTLPTNVSISKVLNTLALLMVLIANPISPDYHDVSQDATEATLGFHNNKGIVMSE